MRFHLLALPNVQTTKAYDLDGFCTMTIRFAKLLKGLGHTVFLYASEENDAPCDKLITCITKKEQEQFFTMANYQQAHISAENPAWQIANPRMIKAIGEHKQPQDMIVYIGGGSQADVIAAHPDLLDVEYSIGYVGNCSRYRVFQSNAWRHHCYGFQNINDVRWFDETIYGFFEEEKFPQNKPEDYFVYVGRYVPKKGLSVVCDAARLAGVDLKLIGHGDDRLVTYGQNLGAIHDDEKIDVVSRARGLICPTCYLEPFGCISPEAQLCGVPVISSDAGGFTETVMHGITGFRCRMLAEFVAAIGNADTLDRNVIRESARAQFGMQAAAFAYTEYFGRLNTLWQKGWHDLDALQRSHAQIQGGITSQRLQEGAGSVQPQASNRYYALGKA